MNVLDLRWFHAIQSLQHQVGNQHTIDNMIKATHIAFQNLQTSKLNNVFLTWQQCMIETMNMGGGNNYRLPHMGKAKLLHRHKLPETLVCPVDIIQKANVNLQSLE